MPSRAAVLLAGLLVLVVPVESRAVFHISLINEVMSGVGGDPSVQYVEIRMLALTQNFPANSRLTAFSCDGTSSQILLVVPGNVGEGVDRTWLMATTNFAAAAGITPDFTWDPTVSGSIPTPCGMVCWGAPGLIPPNPPTWDATNPNNYTDCVAYGGYTGTRKTMASYSGGPTSGTPTGLAPGDGTSSLTRTGATNDNLADFMLASPTPTNNTGQTGFTTSTTVTTTTSTTSTTLLHKSKCTSKEFAAAGKKASAKAKCYSKAVAKNDTSGLSACLGTAETKFGAAYAKATAAGDCLTSASATAVEGEVDSFTSDLNTTLTGGSSGPSKCTSKELSAAGGKAGGKAKCYAKAAAKNDTSGISSCLTAAEMKFTAAYGKAMGAGGCINTTNVGTVESKVDGLVTSLKNSLAPAFP